MNVYELTELLNSHPLAQLRFVLPGGESVPAHFHVTEVARVEKRFIDCGGTQRHAVSCQLQLWTADDFDHQLRADKLGKIISLAEPILATNQLPIEVEYGEKVASLYTVGEVVTAFGTIQIGLVGKQTDCLAKDKCGIDGCVDGTSCC